MLLLSAHSVAHLQLRTGTGHYAFRRNATPYFRQNSFADDLKRRQNKELFRRSRREGKARCEHRVVPDARRKTSSECSHSFYNLWVLTEVETMNTKWSKPIWLRKVKKLMSSNLMKDALITHPNCTIEVIHNGINAISSDQERLLSLWSSKFSESSLKMHAKYFIHIHSTISRAWQQEKLEVNDGGLHKLSLPQEEEAWASTVSRLGNIPPGGSTR